MTTPTNPPRQIKQRYYYIFWSIATITVLIGQIYVGLGYRLMSSAIFEAIDTIQNPIDFENTGTEITKTK